MRTSGVLLPVSSLPSKYGIGSFSQEAYEFVDQLQSADQRYWQILPIGPVGFGDSPYQSVSTYAGNSYYIDLDQLVEEGLLTKEECEDSDFGNDTRYIDYEKIYLSRFPLLRKAYNRSNCSDNKDYIDFVHKNAFWLEDYALYMAIKDSYDGLSWLEWDEDVKFRKSEALIEYENRLSEDIEYYKFIQYLFIEQWNKLKAYANNKEIKIIGDIPIYVAMDSADAWSNPELFQFDENLDPIAVSGCPPDGFSDDGQLWGNPLYRWEVHKERAYSWWISRIKYCFDWYDVLRIDHFKGFDEYYSIPYKSEDTRDGNWEKGPGVDFFQTIEDVLGDLDIIAEDLGYITDSTKELLKKTGFPGMKVLEFAFDPNVIGEGDYLPHNYNSNCVVYPGTHDNMTLNEWIRKVSKEEIDYILKYISRTEDDIKDFHWYMIRLAMSSVANYCIVAMQDYLGHGEEARINEPSTVGDNWKWRLLEGEITGDLINEIKEITKLYGRAW